MSFPRSLVEAAIASELGDSPLAQALRALVAAISANTAAGTLFVYQPGGTAEGNVYTDFSLLSAAAKATTGPKTIFFDDTFAAIVLPAGTYDHGPLVTYLGNLSEQFGTGTSVQFPDGTHLTTLPVALVNVDVGLGNVVASVTDFRSLVMQNAKLESLDAAHSGMTISTTGTLEIWMFGTSEITPTGGHEVIELLGGGATLAILAFDRAFVNDNALRGTGSTTIEMDSPAALLEATQTNLVNPIAWNDLSGLAFAKASFGAVALASTATHEQALLPGSAAASVDLTVTPTTIGAMVFAAKGAIVQGYRVRHTGDAANVAGQNITYQLYLVDLTGTKTLLAGSAGNVAASTGVHTRLQSLTNPVVIPAGSYVQATATPTGALTATVTDIVLDLG